MKTDYRAIRSLCVLLLLVCVVAGCGQDNPLNRQPISGTVTLDGQLLKQGRIEFTPVAAKGATKSGDVITDGKYELVAEKGLPPGKYIVRITAVEGGGTVDASQPPGPGGGEAGKDLIPPKYNTQSKEEVTVVEGQSEPLDFKLTTK